MYRKLLGDKHPSVARGLHNLAVILQRQGKLDAAEAMLREALAKRRELLGNEHPDVATSLEQLAEVLREEAKLDEGDVVAGVPHHPREEAAGRLAHVQRP